MTVFKSSKRHVKRPAFITICLQCCFFLWTFFLNKEILFIFILLFTEIISSIHLDGIIEECYGQRKGFISSCIQHYFWCKNDVRICFPLKTFSWSKWILFIMVFYVKGIPLFTTISPNNFARQRENFIARKCEKYSGCNNDIRICQLV